MTLCGAVEVEIEPEMVERLDVLNVDEARDDQLSVIVVKVYGVTLVYEVGEKKLDDAVCEVTALAVEVAAEVLLTLSPESLTAGVGEAVVIDGDEMIEDDMIWLDVVATAMNDADGTCQVLGTKAEARVAALYTSCSGTATAALSVELL